MFSKMGTHPLFLKSHSWNVKSHEAIKIQERLRKRIILKNGFSRVKSVATWIFEK
jgi:hypothetical protein